MTEYKLPKLNKVQLSGRICTDIEMRYTAKGTPFVKFTLAVDRSVKQADGSYKNEASFIDVVAWSKQAENLAEYAHKGSPVIVEGHLETRSYEDKDNNKRKAVEIIAEYIQFLEYVAKDVADSATTPEEIQAELHPTNDDVPF